MENNLKWTIYALIGTIILVTTAVGSDLVNSHTNTSISAKPGQYWMNVSYATASPAEKMDIYLPDTTGPYPVIIWIHGGGYKSGDKNDNDSNTAKQGLKRGYAVVSINYRLTDAAKFPAQINDVKAAIRFLRANAKEFNLNPDKIAVWGSSAGGGLAALAGTSGNVKELQNDSLGHSDISNQVQAVVDMKGPINFSTMLRQLKKINISQNSSYDYNTSQHMLDQLMGQNISSIPNQVARANPESYISPDDPPFFIVHGTADTLIPYQQSVDFATKLKNVLGNNNVEIELIPGAEHDSPYFTTQQNIDRILDFLDKNLK